MIEYLIPVYIEYSRPGNGSGCIVNVWVGGYLIMVRDSTIYRLLQLNRIPQLIYHTSTV